jgi:hypothetical protein
MNPYTQFLTDEASGVEYTNERWEAWEAGKKSTEAEAFASGTLFGRQEGRREALNDVRLKYGTSLPRQFGHWLDNAFKEAQRG